MPIPAQAQAILMERFHRDALIALATTDGLTPSVRTVDAFYEDGCFYTVTWALSAKMRQIEKNPRVAISGDWFTAHGTGENLGHILLPENVALASKLRVAFAAWYGNGHVNEADPHTVILRVRLTDGVLMSHGERFELDFT